MRIISVTILEIGCCTVPKQATSTFLTTQGKLFTDSRIASTLTLAARQGFEPQYADPKSAVLPLDDRAS